MNLSEFFPDIPQPGWPGRRAAIVREVLRTVWEGLFLVAFIAAMLGIVLLIAAGADLL